MKKFLVMIGLAILLLCISGAAMAYSWQEGIPEEFAPAFTASFWQDYRCVGGMAYQPPGQNQQEGAAAVLIMKKDIDNRLVILEYRGGKFHIVVNNNQPIYQYDRIPQFEAKEPDPNRFTLYYWDKGNEARQQEDTLSFFRDSQGRWRFHGRRHISWSPSADMEQVTVKETDRVWKPGVVLVTTIKDDDMIHNNLPVYGTVETDLRYFTLQGFPKNLKEAREQLSEPPTIPAGELSAKRVRFTSGQNFPVYSGPGEHFLRAANGKALVSTNDWIQVFGSENGWMLIQYDLSSSHMRMGYISLSALPRDASVDALNLAREDAVLSSAQTLTDDPLFSRSALMQLPAGHSLVRLARMGEWAYVETYTGSQPVRGFVLANSLQAPPDSTVAPSWPDGSLIVATPLPGVAADLANMSTGFAEYQVALAAGHSADGGNYELQVHARLPQAWLDAAPGTDYLVTYHLYSNHQPTLVQAEKSMLDGAPLYSFRLPINPAVTVLGLVPEFAISGLKADETLIVKVK